MVQSQVIIIVKKLEFPINFITEVKTGVSLKKEAESKNEA